MGEKRGHKTFTTNCSKHLQIPIMNNGFSSLRSKKIMDYGRRGVNEEKGGQIDKLYR